MINDKEYEMSDLDIAKTTLKTEKLSLVIVKNGQIIYKSDKRGIYPLYMAVKENGSRLEGATAADKVIGRGAAQLYRFAKVKSIYAYMISEGTKEVFDESRITYETEITVPFIKNREGTGMCPVETLSYEAKTFEELILSMEGFLKRINLL
ncbi:MAG TPA: DUF1893 domain-containing protein [Clostridiales bacterium]|nr:DUF1893 domain-containing protein [Clostridiales bacterium]